MMVWDGTIWDADGIIDLVRERGGEAGWGYRYVDGVYRPTIRVETQDGPRILVAGDSLDLDAVGDGRLPGLAS